MSERYILYGAGWEGENFYYQFKEKERIDFVIDANRKGTFHGLNVYRFEDRPINIKKHKIIIATEFVLYFEIRSLLEENDCYNYAWSKVIYEDERKIVIILANCHAYAYKEFLCRNDFFNAHYRIVDIPQVQDFTDDMLKRGGIPSELLDACSVYIHQDIRRDNKISYLLSDEYVMANLKSDCKCITVPNMVGFGKFLFPTVTAESKYKILNNWAVFLTDTLIDSLYSTYYNLSGIVDHLKKDNKTRHSEVVQLFDEIVEKLKTREENWDIKISDYLIDNYQKKKLFYDSDHPTPYLMNEICRRLGDVLELEKNNIIDLDTDMGWREQFVYPFVKNALKLEWEDIIIRKNNYSMHRDKLGTPYLDLKEYVRQYVWWEYSIFLDE